MYRATFPGSPVGTSIRSKSYRALARCFLILGAVIAGLVSAGVDAEPESDQIDGGSIGARLSAVQFFRDIDRQCFMVDLTEKVSLSGAFKNQKRPATLSWTTSGVWHQGQLYLADMSRGPLAQVAFDGSVRSIDQLRFENPAETKEGKKYEELGIVFSVYPRRNGGYLMAAYEYQEVANRFRTVSKLFFVNSEGAIEQEIKPMGRVGFDVSRREDVVSRGFFRMTSMNQGAVIVGDVIPIREDRSPDEYWAAFSYIDDQTFQPLAINLSGDETMKELGNKFYSRDFSLMATVQAGGSDRVFVLVMERNPWIGEVKQDTQEIEPFLNLSAFFEIPYIENRENFATQSDAMRYYRDLYRSVEDNELPIGLFSWGDRLYLLVKREINDLGATKWYAQEVSLSEKSLARRREELPASSAHIALIAGTRNGDPFALVEKGPISINRGGRALPDLLHRSTRSVVVFNEEWFAVVSKDVNERKLACPRLSMAE